VSLRHAVGAAQGSELAFLTRFHRVRRVCHPPAVLPAHIPPCNHSRTPIAASVRIVSHTRLRTCVSPASFPGEQFDAIFLLGEAADSAAPAHQVILQLPTRVARLTASTRRVGRVGTCTPLTHPARELAACARARASLSSSAAASSSIFHRRRGCTFHGRWRGRPAHTSSHYLAVARVRANAVDRRVPPVMAQGGAGMWRRAGALFVCTATTRLAK